MAERLTKAEFEEFIESDPIVEPRLKSLLEEKPLK